MSTVYKNFTDNDRVTVRTLVEEEVDLVGTKYNLDSFASDPTNCTGVSDTYLAVYDVAATETSKNQLFTISLARKAATSSTETGYQKKLEIMYKEFSKLLFGTTDNVVNDLDLEFANSNPSQKLANAIVINFSRSLVKDEIKKKSFELNVKLGTDAGSIKISDSYSTIGVSGGDDTNYKYYEDSPVGEYAPLLLKSTRIDTDSLTLDTVTNGDKVGIIFYQAGVIILSPYIFSDYASSTGEPDDNSSDNIDSNEAGILSAAATLISSGSVNIETILKNTSFNANHLKAIFQTLVAATTEVFKFTSVTELNSTVYFCRVFNNEFNYSTNPTYLSASEIIVKEGIPENLPSSYITTVGLYSDDNQLLAVAKLSEPIKKTPQNELILRTRLDF